MSTIFSSQQLRNATREVGREMVRLAMLTLPATIILIAYGAATKYVVLVAGSGVITALAGFAATLWGCMKPRN